MEVHLTPEQEAQLARIAAQAGANAERLVKDVLVRFLTDMQLPAAIENEISAAERGEFIEDEEMDARVEGKYISPA